MVVSITRFLQLGGGVQTQVSPVIGPVAAKPDSGSKRQTPTESIFGSLLDDNQGLILWPSEGISEVYQWQESCAFSNSGHAFYLG